MSKFYTNVNVWGNKIYVRGFNKENERVAKSYTYEPYLFISSNKESGYKDIFDHPVQKKTFDNMYDAKQYIKQYEDISGINIYGLNRFEYSFIYDHYKNIIPNTKKINTVYLDIEVVSTEGFPKPEDADWPVTAITMIRNDLTVVLGCKDYNNTDKNTYYIKCNDEEHLLRKFVQIFQELDVDVLTGWNTEFFDIPYLINRINKVVGSHITKLLSPWERIREYTVNGMGGSKLSSYEIIGISCLDYLQLYKKFRLITRESYKLDFIAEIELADNKLDYSTDYNNLTELYEKDFQTYIDYNIKDTILIKRLEEKLGYLEQTFAIAYDAGVNFNDALTSVLLWDIIIHNYLLDQNIVIPIKNHNKEIGSIEGGYVKDPHVGMHNWVMSFDLNSLYPSLIQQYNISPDCHINEKQIDNLFYELQNEMINRGLI